MMKKNIAFVINSLEKAGGTERVVSNVSNEIVKESSFNVTIIALTGTKVFFSLDERIDVIFLEKLALSGPFGRARALVRFINQSNFNTVIGISITKLNIWLGFISFFFKKGIRLIASEHINFSKTPALIKLLKYWSYRFFDSVTVLTLFDQNIMDKLGYRNVVQIPNASSFSPESSDITPILQRPKRIISIGRLEEQKGFDLLIKSWELLQLSYPEWELIIVGEGSLKSDLEIAIERATVKLGLFNCTILPFTKDISTFLNSSQVYVLSSRFEGYPMVLVEALTYGCPIVSFDCETGPREIFINEKEGFLVPPSDINSMASKLGVLLKDNELRNSMYHNVIKGRGRFFIESIIQKWKNVV